jgi:hypothetical protein
MKQVLTTMVFMAVAMMFASCEMTNEPDRVITQGEIAGSWSWVRSGIWAYGDIVIDSYGNFTQITKGSGVSSLDENEWITSTGRMTVAGGNVTIVYDGEKTGYTYKIKESKYQKHRWLLDPYSNGTAYMAFGICDDLGMFGSGDW